MTLFDDQTIAPATLPASAPRPTRAQDLIVEIRMADERIFHAQRTLKAERTAQNRRLEELRFLLGL